jgi:hypothetical protein
MSRLKFSPDRDSHLKVSVETGQYLIVDYGREGWDATFKPTSGEEIVLPPAQGGRFHRTSRHAMATCQEHHERTAVAKSGGDV